MNATHLHLMLNHLPILGAVFGLALLAFGLWRNSDELKKTALGVFVTIALLALPVYLTGEPAEDRVKSLPGVAIAGIEQHENAASVAFLGAVVLGLISLAGLLAFRRAKLVPVWFSRLVLTGALVLNGLMAWTANAGGDIRHTEIRSPAGSPALTGVKDRD